jgi:FHA domain-containing protein
LSTSSKLRSNALKDQDRAAPVTVYPSTRKEHPARVCARCFARNVIGETFCKVCGDELPSASVDLDLGLTQRVEVAPVVIATLIVHGDGDVQGDSSLALDKDIVLVGRTSHVDNVRPDVDLSQFDKYNYVSRRHAFILRRQGTIVLEDLESVNGTFVNVTQQLAAHVLTPLRDGDDITFGQTRCTIRIDNVPGR